jgi:cell wall-associated NlpC family hydrolase
MSSTTNIAVTAAVAIIVPIAAAAGGLVAMITGSKPTDCAPSGTTITSVAGYGPAQIANAATIVAVGKQMNVPEQGWVVATAAATQESGLNNLNHGDRDSLGLFQERPSQGWGSPAQIMDTTYSATQFCQHLLGVAGWQQMSVNDAVAQSTPQPGAQEPNSSPALVAVAFACTQLGKPYVWGGNGDPGFDCSGLTHAAYAAAGIAIPRTAQTQYDAGPLLTTGTPLQAGDLVFYGNGPRSVTHVGIAISPTQMIDAPHSGADVEITGVGRYLAASRPVAKTAS